MRFDRFVVPSALLSLALVAGGRALAAEPAAALHLIAKPDVFETLVHPNCSHCRVEAQRRSTELREDDRVLCWVQVQTDNYVNDGVIPIRFFLNKYRVVSDSWGIFVYDPDAGFARGFSPDDGPFRFHGWRNGVMVMKSDKDGTLYSCLTGVAFEGPQKGRRLEPRPTLVTEWGFWNEHYPQSVAYFMYDQFKPVDLPTQINDGSRQSRLPADGRLPADTMVLGVWDGKRARAYPLDAIEKTGVIHDTVDGQPRIVFWYGPTRTAAAYYQPWGTSGLKGDAGWVFSLDEKAGQAPFTNQRIGLHWDITGRAVEGGPRLVWMDSVQVKWLAWAAEYPDTSVYGQELSKNDYRPLGDAKSASASPHGNLDVSTRRFADVQGVDVPRQRVTLLVDGQTEPSVWRLRPGAEVWRDGWWGRLDQFSEGERVWVWFDTDDAKRSVSVSLLADEFSEQDLYAPAKIVATQGSDKGPETLILEMTRAGEPQIRAVKLADTVFYRGETKAACESLKPAETVYVKTRGNEAVLILDSQAFQKRRAAQQDLLHRRWSDEGLPGTLVFTHPERRAVEVMLDHESSQRARSLLAGGKITIQAADQMPAIIQQVHPWRERTQILLSIDASQLAELTVGERLKLLVTAPTASSNTDLPPELGKSQTKGDRLEWLMSALYCTCGMHDGCAGHFFTLAACNAGHDKPCGVAKQTRAQLDMMIDKGDTDQKILEELLAERGPNLLRPHMQP